MIDIDLPEPVAAALRTPAVGERISVEAAGIPWSALSWGDQAARPLVLIHGVTSSAAIWWRVGPALAATGRHVLAVDLPGHGRTGHWKGHHRFRDNAADVADFIRGARLDRDDLQIVGHSYGAMTAAALPAAGLRPATLVLLDPPALTYTVLAEQEAASDDRTYADLDEAIAAVRGTNPEWDAGDVRAKAESLTEANEAAARSVLLENGDWDAGLADLADPAAAGIPVWVIRGEPGFGSYIPAETVPTIEARVGADHVIMIPGAPHSPQRTHPLETTAAILRGLGR